MLTSFYFFFFLSIFSKETINPGQISQMNGVSLNQYKNFEKKWKLVTVRYREDSQEMRVVYANALAENTLKQITDGKKVSYPDGAVFAKIGIKTSRDPLFYSSLVPDSTKRIQFMIKNKRKYKDNDGWNYALFDSNGLTFPGDPEENTQACHACHVIAKEKDFVFSELASINSSTSIQKSKANKLIPPPDLVHFYEINESKFPKSILELNLGIKKMRKYIGPLVNNEFQGTADEIIPTLIEQVKQNNLATLFVTNSEKLFSLVIPSQSNTCSSDNISITIYKSILVPKFKGSSEANWQVFKEEKCLPR